MSATFSRQHGNGAVDISFESRTAQMSALFHIFTCAFCLVQLVSLFCQRCRRRSQLFCLRSLMTLSQDTALWLILLFISTHVHPSLIHDLNEVLTLHRPSPKEHSRTHFFQRNAKTQAGYGTLAGDHQLSHLSIHPLARR